MSDDVARTAGGDISLPEPLGGYAGMPAPPVFASFEEERRHRKIRLAASFRLCARLGLHEGVAGHITVRDPGEPGRFWVNPYGKHFSRIRVSDLVLIDETGAIVEGNEPVNYAAFAIHAGVHASLPSATAVAHSHTVHGKAFAALRRELLPISQEHCIFYHDHVVFEGSVVVLDLEEGKQLGTALGSCHAALMTNHGLLTVGATVESCIWRFITLERCCQVQLLADGAGTPVPLSDAEAQRIHGLTGTEHSCWFAIKSMYELVLSEEPDIAD
jgi:ribulose-5-phosphate 4-epimerase/fuculose-1-phosphate aldolase